MERESPLGVGPGFLNQAQMYGQGQNTAVISSYRVTIAKLETFGFNSFSLEWSLGEAGGK